MRLLKGKSISQRAHQLASIKNKKRSKEGCFEEEDEEGEDGYVREEREERERREREESVVFFGKNT